MSDADVPECRICHGVASPTRPLFHPCRCSGSIRHTHESCLVNWLSASRSASCELCGHAFVFEPLYIAGAPPRLGARDLVAGVVAKARSGAQAAARIALVVGVWLFVLPLGTCWVGYALFEKEVSGLPARIGRRGLPGVAGDAFYGCLLSAGIVFVFLSVTSLREYLRQLPEEGDEVEGRRAEGREGVDVQEGGWERAFEETTSEEGDAGFGSGGSDAEEEDRADRELAIAYANRLLRGDRAVDDYDYDLGPAHAAGADAPDLPPLVSSDDESEELRALQQEVAEHAAAHHQNRAELDVGAGDDDGGALFGLFELDPDEVPLEEMVGLRGNIRNLFDNAGTVLVSNAIFLGIFALIPLLVGRLAQKLTGPALEKGARTAADASASAVAPAAPSGALMSYSDDLFVVLLGYGVLALCAFGYVVVGSLLRSRFPRFDTPMTRQIVRALRYLATFAKIVILIIFEFGIFPLGCGWWIDACSVGLFGTHFAARVVFCRQFPWTSTAAHWFVGIFYMVHVSLFITLLRHVLRPPILWFLRNPDDPDFRPFRELVEKPLSRHARRMCLSAFIYLPLVGLLVHMPTQFGLNSLPHVFPLNLSDFSSSLVEIPFGNLLILPLVSIFHHAKLGGVLRKGVHAWIVAVSTSLGIEHVVVKDEVLFPTDEFGAGGAGGGGGDDADVGLNDDLFDPFVDEDLGGRQGDGIPLVAGGTAVDTQNASAAGAQAGNPTHAGSAWPRGLVMLFMAWGTFSLAEVVALAVPVILGRSLLAFVGLPHAHDLHALGLGAYIVLGSYVFGNRVHAFLSRFDTATALRVALPYVAVVAKSLVIVFFWLGIIPLGAGLLVELMITIPLRVAFNESPYIYVHQDWALGVLLLKVASRIVLAGGVNAQWRTRLERAREGGFLGVGQNFERTWREVVFPVVYFESIALALPYAFSHGVLLIFGVSRAVRSFVYRYVYLLIALLYVAHFAVLKLKSALYSLHDSIRDDKYKIKDCLRNM